MNRFYILIFSSTIFLSGIHVQAQYYVNDYDPDYVPYNLQEAIENIDYKECETQADYFDATYNKYLILYGTPVSVGDTLDFNYGALKESVEENIRQCMINYRKDFQNDAIKNCDFGVIDSLSDVELDSYSGSEIAECEINRCNFVFINAMSSGDKVKYNKEIDVCETRLEEESVDIEPVAEIESIPPISIASIYTPTVYEPIPEPVSVQEPVHVEQNKEIAEVADEVSTTAEPETLEITAKELESLVEERIEKALKKQSRKNVEAKEKPKQNIVKRFWIFVTSWF